MDDALRSEGVGEEPLLALEDVTVRVRDHKLLPHTTWKILRGEQWAVLGPNGSGKSSLVRTIAGELPSASGTIRLQPGQRVALVSFEAQAALYAREVELDLARHFAGRPNERLTARELLSPPIDGSSASQGGRPTPNPQMTSLLDDLEIEHLLDRPFRHLSAGEMRKALIARALATAPTLLILDEPFDGLDMGSRQTLANYLERLMAEGKHLIIVTHRADEIPDSVTHVFMVKDGRIAGRGARAEMLAPARIEALYGAPLESKRPRTAALSAPALERASGGAPLVELTGVSVEYEGVSILRDLSWRIFPGERWGLFGPNGSGKTTILNLIAGDNLQAYANDIRLFGRRRGSGESVWEIKRNIGLVTPNLQLGYRHSVTGIEVVLSGFFDSIGLYRRPSAEETEQAGRWLQALEIEDLADRHFSRLSYGQRRLLLIARAMVKNPRLLILDEPCQGLDPANRHRVLDAIDAACASADTSLLYVT
ncbi:MAG TPA: ATP-binding cassette domain-containing protein, partial [Spirochaetia bacterium]|nr:ATP-binding cassette domain-containing protein [Spirochaetia bacterium]